MRDLSGCLVPLPVAFVDDTGSISEVRLGRLIRFYRDQGASGFVLNSDLGEFTSLSTEERVKVAEIVQRDTQGQVPLLVHVTTLSTTNSLFLAQHAARIGAKGIVLMPPFYYRLRDDEVAAYFTTVAEYAGIPMLVVDPVGLLTPEVRTQLQSITGLHLGKTVAPHLAVRERVASDEFSIGEAVCTALAAWSPAEIKSANPKLEAMRALFRAAGSVRVVKALLNWQDQEVGPTRGPFLDLLEEHRKQLVDLLR